MSDQLIQGRQADSQNEVNFARALEKFRLYYIYQYSILGGTSVRGGYVLDFFLPNQAPQPVAVNIQGKYWHRKSSSEEAFETATITAYCNQHGIYYVQVEESETETVEAAEKAIREKVGV